MALKSSIYLIFFSALFYSGNLIAQTQHHPYYDIEKKVHFGFSMGTNFSDLQYRFSENYYGNDSLNSVNMSVIPGISLGAICNFHIRERLDLRIIPSLLLSQRNVEFFFANGAERIKTIESVYANLPLLLKYKSTRHGNWRFYTLGGLEYSYDIASQQGSEKDFFDPNIALRTNNFSYSFGCGFDLYFPYFKFSPEIRVANGFNNVLDPHETVYSDSFSKMKNRMILISFHFE